MLRVPQRRTVERLPCLRLGAAAPRRHLRRIAGNQRSSCRHGRQRGSRAWGGRGRQAAARRQPATSEQRCRRAWRASHSHHSREASSCNSSVTLRLVAAASTVKKVRLGARLPIRGVACQSPANHQPITSQSPANHLPTTSQPPANHPLIIAHHLICSSPLITC